MLVLLEELQEEQPASIGIGLLRQVASETLDRHGGKRRHSRPLSFVAAEQPLHPDLEVALGQQGIDGLVFEGGTQRQDLADHLPQRCHLDPEALDLSPLGGRQGSGGPPVKLLVVEPQIVVVSP